jgi:hypothetical protein
MTQSKAYTNSQYANERLVIETSHASNYRKAYIDLDTGITYALSTELKLTGGASGDIGIATIIGGNGVSTGNIGYHTVQLDNMFDNAVDDRVLAVNAVHENHILNGQVSTPKLQDGALSADATGRAKMANLFVTTAKLDDHCVTSIKLDSAGVALPSGSTATTQSLHSNSLYVATTAFVQQEMRVRNHLTYTTTTTASLQHGSGDSFGGQGDLPAATQGLGVFDFDYQTLYGNTILEVDANVIASSNNQIIVLALFVDDAFKTASSSYVLNGNHTGCITLRWRLVLNSPSPVTKNIKLRLSTWVDGNTVYLNRSQAYATPFQSGGITSSASVTEYAPL